MLCSALLAFFELQKHSRGGTAKGAAPAATAAADSKSAANPNVKAGASGNAPAVSASAAVDADGPEMYDSIEFANPETTRLPLKDRSHVIIL